MFVCPAFANVLAICEHANPALRKSRDMNMFLRSCNRLLNAAELAKLVNTLGLAFQHQTKFALDLGLAMAKYFAKQDMATKEPEIVTRGCVFWIVR